MIDYKVLPQDGILFEQLIRELFECIGNESFWTGVGPDGGRDLIVKENLIGNLSRIERRWLVNCKHYAISGRSVGVDDIINITDTLSAVDATGLILACTTYPSAALIRRLDEIKAMKKIFDYIILDNVGIEKKLLQPNTIHLLNRFFPDDIRNKQWIIHSTEDIGVWSASYLGHYFFYTCRDSISRPPLDSVQLIIETFDPLFEEISNLVKEITDNPEFTIIFRYRGFYYDDKHCHFIVYIDCQLEESEFKGMETGIKSLFPEELAVLCEDDGEGKDSRYANITNIDLKFTYPSFFSDHYQKDRYQDYNPFIKIITSGKARGWENLVW